MRTRDIAEQPWPVKQSSSIGFHEPIAATRISAQRHLAAAQSLLPSLTKLVERSKIISRDRRETEWLAKHRDEFRGSWIALDGDHLLAQAQSAKEVFAAIEGYKPTPSVIHVPEQELPFAGW